MTRCHYSRYLYSKIKLFYAVIFEGLHCGIMVSSAYKVFEDVLLLHFTLTIHACRYFISQVDSINQELVLKVSNDGAGFRFKMTTGLYLHVIVVSSRDMKTPYRFYLLYPCFAFSFVLISSGIAGAVALSGHSANIVDAYLDQRFNSQMDRTIGYRTRTILCSPVLDRRGNVVAVIQVFIHIIVICTNITPSCRPTMLSSGD